MSPAALLDAAHLAVLGTLSVSLWTVRVALTARGRRLPAAALAGLEAVVFAVAFSTLLSSLDAPLEIAGYAVGVATGTLLGVVVDGRFSGGQSAVRVVVDGDGADLTRTLRDRGWPVTVLPGDGVRGHVALLLVVVDDLRVAALVGDLQECAPAAFWSVERVQRTQPARLPAAFHQGGAPLLRRSRRSAVSGAR
jgi:uncharacterized protein YebE (UPF0316 family)